MEKGKKCVGVSPLGFDVLLGTETLSEAFGTSRERLEALMAEVSKLQHERYGEEACSRSQKYELLVEVAGNKQELGALICGGWRYLV